MPVKYQCAKCGRRFADWGAERLGFRCPQDDKCPPDAIGQEYELVRIGAQETEPAAPAPPLRRRPPKEVIGVSTFEDDAPVSPDLNEEPFSADAEESDDESEEEEETAEGDDTAKEKVESSDDEEEEEDEEELDGELEFSSETPDFEEDV